MAPDELVLTLKLGPQLGAVFSKDELGLVSVNQEPLLDEERLDLSGQVGEASLKIDCDQNYFSMNANKMSK